MSGMIVADGHGPLHDEALGQGVGPVVELLHGVQNPEPCRLAHLVRALVDDPRNAGDGYPARFGYIHMVANGLTP